MQEKAKKLANILYLLYVIGIFTGIAAIVAIIINHVKRSSVKGTLAESHFRWQIRTFWFGFLWTVVGFILTYIFIGLIILIADFIWIIYRYIRGWVALNEGKPMYVKKGKKKAQASA